MPGAAASHPALRSDALARLTSRESVQTLEELQPGCFSACTCTVRDRHVIVYSPLASVGRMQSDAAHEVSHIRVAAQQNVGPHTIGGVSKR
jgi:hypothetical protein